MARKNYRKPKTSNLKHGEIYNSKAAGKTIIFVAAGVFFIYIKFYGKGKNSKYDSNCR